MHPRSPKSVLVIRAADKEDVEEESCQREREREREREERDREALLKIKKEDEE